MTDTYQAVYDATRSKMGNGDIGAAVEAALHAANIGDSVARICQAITEVVSQHEMPSAVYRPKLFVDGNQWCAMYGDNLQNGVAGFGKSPSDAMWDFNKSWNDKLK